jgi:hypothetical protein
MALTSTRLLGLTEGKAAGADREADGCCDEDCRLEVACDVACDVVVVVVVGVHVDVVLGWTQVDVARVVGGGSLPAPHCQDLSIRLFFLDALRRSRRISSHVEDTANAAGQRRRFARKA